MKFIWAGNRNEKNSGLCFSACLSADAVKLRVCAADFFRVYADGKLVSYGPERTAAGYAIVREINVVGIDNIRIVVDAYNVPCYACDCQLPYFAAEILNAKGEVLLTSNDFSVWKDVRRCRNVPRYSYQRGFLEVYDYTKDIVAVKEENVYAVSAPVFLNGIGDTADYREITPTLQNTGVFNGFDDIQDVWWTVRGGYKSQKGDFDVYEDFVNKVNGYDYSDYTFGRECTGFVGLNVETQEECEIFAVFEEFLPDGEWRFRRTACNDFIRWKLPIGKFHLLSAEPYALQFLKIIYKGKAKIAPFMVALENAQPSCVQIDGNEKIVKLFNAAESSFRQNAFDIFTDCPGRERAGWLCDSYFTAQTERLFFGNSRIEKRFLENYVIGEYDEIEANMLPDCFPAQHTDCTFIPNWAMWFVIELYEYYQRTGDRAFINRAKKKVNGLLRYFSALENEYGLLEDLRGWIFIEWSVSNSPDYVQGVNFPSNMLYAYMLEKTAALYNDNLLFEKAASIKVCVREMSFDGNFFADNAVRINGKLTRCGNHVSETCQYYALFTKTACGEKFADFSKKMSEEFGPKRTDKYPEIGRSNMFIGNYLRFFWLCEAGESDRVLQESVEYFYGMAERTGTLWEKDDPALPSMSCNHGFASVAAVLILRCLIGYKTVKDDRVVLDNRFKASEKYGVQITLKYGDNTYRFNG